MRKRHLNKERDVIRNTREKLETNFSDKKAKEAKRIENQNKLMTSLQKHNGPCQTIAELPVTGSHSLGGAVTTSGKYNPPT